MEAIKVEFGRNESLEAIAKQAVAIVNDICRNVDFVYDGIDFYIYQHTTYDDIMEQYNNIR